MSRYEFVSNPVPLEIKNNGKIETVVVNQFETDKPTDQIKRLEALGVLRKTPEIKKRSPVVKVDQRKRK